MPPPLSVLTKLYEAASQGVSKTGRVFGAKDIEELWDQVASYARPRALSPDRSQALSSLLREAENPSVNTHVLYTGKDFTEPAAAFQLTAEHELGDIGNYMPNLVSLLGSKGVGTQALQEARRFGPYGLVSTPTSRPFYEKMIDGRLKGFQPHEDPDLRGIAYQHKKKGGLVQYSKECSCGR